MKFNTQHFPVGTIFLLEDSDLFSDKSPRTILGGVSTNGSRSYLLPTDKLEKGQAESFNLEFVKSILKRGEGPMAIFDTLPKQVHAQNLKEDVREAEVLNSKGMYCRRNYQTFNLLSVLYLELEKFLKPLDRINEEKMVSSFLAQTWQKSVLIEGEGFSHQLVNKKRMSKWMKQNYSRFLQNLNGLKKKENLEYEDYSEGLFLEERNMVKEKKEKFLTNFSLTSIGVYREAVEEYSKTPGGHKLLVKETDCHGGYTGGSVWLKGGSPYADLTPFWSIFEKAKEKPRNKLSPTERN